jgi:L,D-transpeptidase ErfK/SrfK
MDTTTGRGSRRGVRHAVAIAVVALLHAGTVRAAGITGATTTYTVQTGDTLFKVAATVGEDVRTIARDNGLDPARPIRVGLVLRIDARHVVPDGAEGRTLTVNIPQRMVFLHEAGMVSAFPVAVGRSSWPTPTGAFTVVSRVQDPTWHVPVSILAESRRLGRVQAPVVPPGPDNPLGSYWLGLSLGGIGIHGTNAPASIYRVATHGCVRVGLPHIETLFERVTVGASGEVIYQPFLLTESGADVYLEVHADVYRRYPGEVLPHVTRLAATSGLTDRIDWSQVAAVIAERAGIARVVTRRPALEAPVGRIDRRE